MCWQVSSVVLQCTLRLLPSFGADTDSTPKIFPRSVGKGGSCSRRGSGVMMQSSAGFSPFNKNLSDFLRCLGNPRRPKPWVKNCSDLQRRMLRPRLARGRSGDGGVVYCSLLAWRWYPSPWARHGATPRDWSLLPTPCRTALTPGNRPMGWFPSCVAGGILRFVLIHPSAGQISSLSRCWL